MALDCDPDENWCNGTEDCVDGQCVYGDDPCPGLLCDDDLDECITDPPIPTGRCCWNMVEGVFLNCDETYTLADCDGVSGVWEGGGTCPCPKYGAGWVPSGDYLWNIGPIEGEIDCEYFFRVGDDYTVANSEYMSITKFKFVGGADCTGTGENSGDVLFEWWDTLPVSGDPVLVDARLADFECENYCQPPVDPANPVFCPLGTECTPDQICDNDAGVRFWILTMNPLYPLVIPPSGYVTMSPYDEDETCRWISTEAVDVGTGDPELLWVNDQQRAYLSDSDYDGLPDAEGDPDLLIFEFVGDKIAAPDEACCDDEGGCTDVPAWICLGQGSLPQGVGTTCLDEGICEGGACCVGDVYPGHTCEDVASEGACTTLGGLFLGFGTDCDPDCCPMIYTGGDTCNTAVMHTIVVPPEPPALPVVITISGDNSAATPDACFGLTDNELGWFEAFDLVTDPANDCAMVEIDVCCTDPVEERRYYIILTGTCGVDDSCADNEYSEDWLEAGWCGPGDDNSGRRWEAVPGGDYYYPVLSDAVDYPEQLGPYQMHVTVSGCALRACCLPAAAGCTYPDDDQFPFDDGCVVVNTLDCSERGGWFMDDTPLCVEACDLGACCAGPGECTDGGGVGMNCTDCQAGGGTYIGGARCVDNPCPICSLTTEAGYCYAHDGNYITFSDRNTVSKSRVCEDFRAESGGTISEVCWYPCFYNGDLAVECADSPPADAFEITIYPDTGGNGADLGGMPDEANPLAPGTQLIPAGPPPGGNIIKQAEGSGSRCWEYSATLPTPVEVEECECYWVEITGYGEGANGCEVYMGTSTQGNQYYYSGAGGPYEAGNIVSSADVGGTIYREDISICVDVGIADPPCDDVGACCYPPGSVPLCAETDHETCVVGPDGISGTDDDGMFNPIDDCVTAGCPAGAPINDNCVDAIDLNSLPGCATWPGVDGDELCEFDFSNIFATLDGDGFFSCEGGPAANYGADIWYTIEVPPTCVGSMTVEACNYCTDGVTWCFADEDCPGAHTCVFLTNYDQFHDIYLHSSSDCGCSENLGDRLDCDDEGCAAGSLVGGPATLSLDVVGNCYTLRIGGWIGADNHMGTGHFRVLADMVCGAGETAAPPLPEVCPDSLVVPGQSHCGPLTDSCASDGECVNQSICVKEFGAATGTCYAPKTRYLSMRPNPKNDGPISTARRISLDDGARGPGAFVGWVGDFFSGGGLDMATVEPTLLASYYHTTTVWDDPLHVCDCEVATGQVYCVQAIFFGADTGDELNYSRCLRLNTPTKWGDVVGNCPGDVCNPPQGTVNLDDIMSKIKKFQAIPVAPLTWLDDGSSEGDDTPNQGINLTDIMNSVKGFQGVPYPGDGPLGCNP